MTMQQQRQEATNLNNSAAIFLQIERPNDAMRALRRAALALQEAAITSSIKSTTPMGPDSTRQQGMFIIRPVEMHLKQTPSGSTPRDETLQPIYDRALTVSNSCQDDEVISATVLYNMALLHHLRGLDQGKSVSLDKALHLYQAALAILARCDLLESTSSIITCHHSINLLHLALLNNSAQIYLQLFQRQDLDESISYMRYILDDTINSSPCCREENEEDDGDFYSFFVMSVMICSGDLLNIAPAA
jgi:tetratricopeptide (TPR) repeat protein